MVKKKDLEARIQLLEMRVQQLEASKGLYHLPIGCTLCGNLQFARTGCLRDGCPNKPFTTLPYTISYAPK